MLIWRISEMLWSTGIAKGGFVAPNQAPCDGVHGIDGVYRRIFGGDVTILESKFRTTFRKTWNPETLLGRGYGHRQMSVRWIEAVMDMMETRMPDMYRYLSDVRTSNLSRMINVLNDLWESILRRM